jgi:hypothetical protein
MLISMRWILLVLLFGFGAFAQDEPPSTKPDVPPGYLKRIVVFPMESSKPYSKVAEDAWWKLREQLTDTKRFWVATKRFLVQKDVYQPRSKLTPPDAILLGQLLDCDGLMVTSLKGRELISNVYSRYDGSIIWTSQVQLHPSIPIEEQLADVAVKQVRDFIATIPYHGFEIVDPIINKPVFEEGDVKLAKVDVGGNSRAVEGDTVQWVTIEKTTSSPLLQGGSHLDVVAEGQVVKNENGILLVEVKRARDISLLKQNTLVRLPKETEYLNANYAMQSNRALSPEVRFTPLPPTHPESEETKPLVAAIAGIANAALFLLLAF